MSEAALELLSHEVQLALRQALRETLTRAALQQNLDELIAQLLHERITGVPPRRIEPPAAAAPRQAPLSAREREILERIGAGDSNKAIARQFELSPHTVKRHVANIFAKLDVSSRVQAAAWIHARH
jgi:DNA-binding CsgD family transcriptional regulator